MDRTILHCDCNGFYASVACVEHPHLRQVPMAVCGNPKSRHGIILAKNELAKGYGIKTAETVWQARQKCPDLVLTPPKHDQYRAFSQKVNAIYHQYTDLVEPFGIDESWLDVTGSYRLFGDGKTIADRLRQQVQEELGLTISVGVSFNKVFAKLGSDYKKPNATTVIDRDLVASIVYPLPASDLLYVGKQASEKLKKMGVHTIGDLAVCDKARLSLSLGKLGLTIWQYANGLDDTPVRPYDEKPEVKSVGNGWTFHRNLQGLEDIKVGLLMLCDEVATRLRRYGLKCTAVQVQIKDPDFRVISRQTQLSYTTDLAHDLSHEALQLITRSWDLQKPIRMLTVTALGLTDKDEGVQLDLFAPTADTDREKFKKLEQTMDSLRHRFGTDALQWGSVLQSDISDDPSEED